MCLMTFEVLLCFVIEHERFDDHVYRLCISLLKLTLHLDKLVLKLLHKHLKVCHGISVGGWDLRLQQRCTSDKGYQL